MYQVRNADTCMYPIGVFLVVDIILLHKGSRMFSFSIEVLEVFSFTVE